MGDLKKDNAVGRSIDSRDTKRSKSKRPENKTIDRITDNPRTKDKAISARVNSTTYAQFKAICTARGITANAALNMIITDFVRENKNVLDDYE